MTKPLVAYLYRMPVDELRRYVRWVSAFAVEGERLDGKMRSPYHAPNQPKEREQDGRLL